MHTTNQSIPLLLTFVLTAGACGAGSIDSQQDESGPLEGLQSLTITPSEKAVVVSPESPKKLDYTVMGTFPSGTRDVTEHVVLSLEDATLGTFGGATLTTTDSHGGRTDVIATAGSVSAKASLIVKISIRTSASDAPAGVEALFDKATDGSGPGPALVYPPGGALLPPNLSELEAMWTDSGGHDLWELSFQSDVMDIKVYGTKLSQKITGAIWNVLASSNVEGSVTISVRGLSQASPLTSARSGEVSILLARDSVQGGLYYWAATASGGIIRYDFGRPDQKAEAFYTMADANDCVACHALSPDGKHMALTFTGGDGPAGILEVSKRTLTANKTYAANFQVYTPDNKYLITSSKGVLSARDPVAGTAVATLSTGGKATMPDVSPDGKTLAFVRPLKHELDWKFSGGSIVTAPINDTSVGPPTVLVQGTATENNYYPAFSPDGRWIIFNRSTGDSYSDDDATLYVVKTTGGAPIKLARTNSGTGLRNSWARWSPFIQTYKGRKLLWLTFSSTRDYGTALVNSAQPSDQRTPQLWMAAFDTDWTPSPGPDQTASPDPGFPAFWLPFQDIKTNNHIAQWTKKVVNVE
jgi:TolB protein